MDSKDNLVVVQWNIEEEYNPVDRIIEDYYLDPNWCYPKESNWILSGRVWENIDTLCNEFFSCQKIRSWGVIGWISKIRSPFMYRIVINDNKLHQIYTTNYIDDLKRTWIFLKKYIINQNKDIFVPGNWEQIVNHFIKIHKEREGLDIQNYCNNYKNNSLNKTDFLKHKIKAHPHDKINTLNEEDLGTIEGLYRIYFTKDILDIFADRKIKVKFVLIKSGIWDSLPSALQKFLSSYSNFGLYHSALIVGCYLIEWSRYGIVNIRNIKNSRKAEIYYDLGEIDVSQIHDMCKVIIKWNKEKEYNRLNSNCQQFVTEVIEVLGLKGLEEEKLLIERIKKSGIIDTLLYEQTTGKPLYFDSHEQYDEYIRKTYGNGLQNLPNYNLLKAIDRTFWPLDWNYKGDCPFKNPQETFSMIKI